MLSSPCRRIFEAEIIVHLPGHYIGQEKRDHREKDSSRGFWHVLFFSKGMYWFTHPFKLHGKKLDTRLNLVMFKRFLLEKVKELTEYSRDISRNDSPEKFENAASFLKPTVHTNPSRKRSFLKTLFKPKQFIKADFSFSCVDGKHFNGDLRTMTSQ